MDEAKKWFKDLFQGCYLKKLDKYPNRIFWIYDKNLIQKKKINLEMSDGELIFEQDEKNGNFSIKYNNYWKFLQSNFNLSNKQVKDLTADVVNEVLNCNQYKTKRTGKVTKKMVNEILNSNQYNLR